MICFSGFLATVPEEVEHFASEDKKSKFRFLKKLSSLKVHQIVFSQLIVYKIRTVLSVFTELNQNRFYPDFSNADWLEPGKKTILTFDIQA